MAENNENFFQENADSIVFLVLTIACLIVYGQLINADFINIDDHSYVYKNPPVLSGINWDSIRWSFTAFHSSNWHPLTWLSHALDVQLFGLKPGFHHATNIIFHIINSILAFVVFRRFTGDFWKSAIIAALFALHPAHVESVAWISERKDVLSTFFWLLSMWIYVRYAEGKKKNPEQQNETANAVSPRFLALALFLTLALGLMSKPMLVTLPFVFLLMDFWTLERLKSLRDLPPLIIEKLPLFALSAASSIITFLAQKQSGAVQTLEYVSFSTRAINSIMSYAKYVLMLFYPVNLGVWYPFKTQLNIWIFVGAILLLAGITIFCIWQRRKRKYLLTGWLWFLGTLVPVIGIVQVGGQSLADRYTYIPYFGLFIMLVWGAGEIFERLKLNYKIAAAVCAVILFVLSALTFKQVSYWQNSGTLYTHTLSFTKNNLFLMNNLCLHYITTEKKEAAEQKCSAMLEGVSDDPKVYNTLGILQYDIGKNEKAIKNFQKAIALKLNFGIVYSRLSAAYAKQGDLAEAEKNLQIALTMNDESLNRDILANNCYILASEFAKKNQNEKAVAYLEKAVELNPDFKEAKENLDKIKGEK